MKKTVIILPVVNEEKNIFPIFNKIKDLKIRKLDILFIDDRSTDNTRKNINLIKKNSKIKIFTIYRNIRPGIGDAHKTAIKWAKRGGYKFAITIDADGTFNPKDIINMQKLFERKKFQIINSSRFKKKNGMRQWPFFRKFLTILRSIVIRIIFGINFDTSSGFRFYNLRNINIKILDKINDNFYFFTTESLIIFYLNNYKIGEISSTLNKRAFGKSKMSFFKFLKSIYSLIKFSIKFYFNRNKLFVENR